MYVVLAVVVVLLFLVVACIVWGGGYNFGDLKPIEKIEIDKLIEGVDFVLVNGVRKDAKEFSPKYRDIIKKVKREAYSKVSPHDQFWLYMWEFMKKQLKEKYDIDWRSMAELNPEHTFD
jgi:hypothetical protein